MEITLFFLPVILCTYFATVSFVTFKKRKNTPFTSLNIADNMYVLLRLQEKLAGMLDVKKTVHKIHQILIKKTSVSSSSGIHTNAIMAYSLHL